MKAKIIPLSSLAISFIPILALLIIYFKSQLEWKSFFYACLRMISQLLLIGYVLNYIFQQDNIFQTGTIIVIMLLIASWISLYSIKRLRKIFLKFAIIALLFGAIPVLLLITIFVLPSEHWYNSDFLIPLAGMVLSSSMNTISLSAERFETELKNNTVQEAKKIAFKTALIPLLNTYMAVGLVSLPGMMTGQILAGISPLLAVRYQIVVMTMVMGAGGLSVAIFLKLRTQPLLSSVNI